MVEFMLIMLRKILKRFANLFGCIILFQIIFKKNSEKGRPREKW